MDLPESSSLSFVNRCRILVDGPVGELMSCDDIVLGQPGLFEEFFPEGGFDRVCQLDTTLAELPDTYRVFPTLKERNMTVLVIDHRTNTRSKIVRS